LRDFVEFKQMLLDDVRQPLGYNESRLREEKLAIRGRKSLAETLADVPDGIAGGRVETGG
jgi:hypothetical protein